MENTPNPETEEYLYEVLIPAEVELSERFAWNHETHGFDWTGTDAERAEMDRLRDEIARHPVIVAEDRLMMRAEARMNR
ncbi:MAG TPA: hypothetical protein VMW08_00065 [Acidimicrobiales bacterium]|nr:hypothetical protein [Acidimicrobiales bacterium]